MTNEELKQLLKKYNEGNCTIQEEEAINLWVDSIGENSDFELDDEEYGKYIQLIREKIKENTSLFTVQSKSQKSNFFYKKEVWATAAVLLIVFSCSLFFIIKKGGHKKPILQAVIQNFPPGGNHAYLTLSNGTRISLDSLQNGNMLTEDNSTVSKQHDGQLSYQTTREDTSSKNICFNILSTPKGGQYQLTLSDGTTVKLNAASSIRYPVCFTGADRTVYIKGEVYFEVKHNNLKPFKVMTEKTVIEDLGTVFNVNAYDDEQFTKTTLLEGAVKVANEILKPGEQAVIDNQTENLKVEKADINAAFAWTKGLLSANDIDLEELMKQLSRWYNVDVRYEGKIPSLRVGGIIGRNTNLSNILTVLSANDIHARLVNKTIIITP